MTEVIFGLDGIIDKFVGDGILAYFGAPLKPEGHAKRAVQAAVTMREEMQHLQNKWYGEKKPILYVGIGINTGEVVMGSVGSENYMNFTLIGDAVNVASRLSDEANKGEILISEETFLQAKRHVETWHAEKLEVKNRKAPVQTYAVADYIDEPAKKEKAPAGRREAEAKILLKVVELDDDFREVEALVYDGGFRVLGSRWVKPGSDLSVKVPLPSGVALEDVGASVLACGETPDGQTEMRAKFTTLTERQRVEVMRFVYAHG
jgi:adenylate cyclase